jgi:hypothetical protein
MTQRGTSAAKRRQQSTATQWTIPGFDQPFVQDPLSFFERNELFGTVAKALDRALADGQSVMDLLGAMDIDEVSLQRLRRGNITADGLMAANLVGPLLRIVGDYPDLLEKVYLLALSVPKHQRELVSAGLAQIDDDTGFGIWDAFVEQNTEDLKRFGVRWWETIAQTIQRIQGDDDSPTPTS